MPALTPAEQDALVRFDPKGTSGHVESLFLKLNLPGEGRAVWLKITFLRKAIGAREAVVEAWAMAFDMGAEPGEHVAIKRTLPYSEATLERGCLYVRAPGVELKMGQARGELVDEVSGDTIAWDLTFETEHIGFRHMPFDWMYEGRIPKSKANSPAIDSRFRGTVTVNGRETRIEDAPGMFGHNWGSEHAQFWTWAHCNVWEGVDGVLFEGVTSNVKFGPVTSPRLTILHARIPGERITMNGVRQLVATRSEVEGLSWVFRGTRGDRRIEGRFHAPADRFVGVDYHDPSGRIAHCLNTKIADGELVISGRGKGGWKPLLSAVSQRSAALEIGTRGDTRGVRIRIR